MEMLWIILKFMILTPTLGPVTTQTGDNHLILNDLLILIHCESLINVSDDHLYFCDPYMLNHLPTIGKINY